MKSGIFAPSSCRRRRVADVYVLSGAYQHQQADGRSVAAGVGAAATLPGGRRNESTDEHSIYYAWQ